jgi:glycosyltransferase involved in cell wall biosynthesis
MSMAGQDARLRIFRLNGQGVCRARNFGISRAVGTYVAFFEAKDRWYPDKLATQLAFHLAHPEVIMSFTDHDQVDFEGVALGSCFDQWPYFRENAGSEPEFHCLGPKAAALLFAANVVGISTVVAKREALQSARSFDVNLQFASTWDLWLKLAFAGPVAFTNRPFTSSLIHPYSLHSATRLRLHYLKAIIRRYEIRVLPLKPSALLHARAWLAMAYAEYYRAQNKRLQAFLSRIKALCLTSSCRPLRTATANGLRLPGLKR